MAVLTKEAVDWFFKYADTSHFRQIERTKKMCEMRLQGITYSQIGKELNIDIAYASNTVQRIVREYANHLKGDYGKSGEFTAKEIHYIKTKYRITPIEDIARKLRRSVRLVENQMCEMMAQGIISNNNRGLNPNPITNTTKMLVCRYYEDNMQRGMTEMASKYNIACDLGREVATIEEILAECKANGMYEFFNEREVW